MQCRESLRTPGTPGYNRFYVSGAWVDGNSSMIVAYGERRQQSVISPTYRLDNGVNMLLASTRIAMIELAGPSIQESNIQCS